jgi:tetratricopeptide (TPR) repeat protein
MSVDDNPQTDQTESLTSRSRSVVAFFARGISFYIAAGGLLSLGQYFHVEPFQQPISGWLFFCVLVALLWLGLELALSGRIAPIRFWNQKQTLADALLAEVNHMANKRNYEAILRYRGSFGRSLWLDGMPHHRLQLAHLAQVAALHLDDKRSYVEILIDDIGWTHVSLQHYPEASQNILHGLQIARHQQFYYWIAKAHRHLAGIAIEQHNYVEAETQLANAERACGDIQAQNELLEMSAGIQYGKAVLALRTGQHKEALACLVRSEELRKTQGDRSRIVKIHALRGNIAEVSRDLPSAFDAYTAGYGAAEHVARRDEMIRNLRGLTRVSAALGRHEDAVKYKATAAKLEKHSPIPFDLSEQIVIEVLKQQQIKELPNGR